MSKIEEMINQLCPNGVEFKKLGDVAQFVRGNGMPRADLTEEGVGAIHYGQIYTHYGIWAKKTISFVDPRTSVKLAKVEPGDLIITNTSENIEDVGKAVAWLGEQPIVTGGHATVIKHNQDPKFLSYWFQSESFFRQKKRLASGTKVIDVSANQLATVRVPVPPLEVQCEIVRVLDELARVEQVLEAELQAELEAREVQFAHSRDSLLRFDDARCEWRTLKEVAIDFGRGKSKHRPRNDSKLFGGPYPFIQTGDVRRSTHLITEYSQTYNERGLAQSKLWPKGTICITIAANIAETGVLSFDACFPDSVIGMIVDSEETSEYFVEYLLQSFKESLAAKGRGSAQENINLATFENERFPFPSLEEQHRIVDTLDSLGVAVNDLSIALSEELAARRQQYEYYRDRLLTFEELQV